MDERLIQQQEQELAKTGRYYLHVCFMTIPLLCMACFLYGLRPLLLCGAALLTGNLCDRLVSLLRRRVYRAGDFSNESFALIIALLMPATVDWYVVIMAVLAGVLIGKEVFGGYGSYPFNPAAVGYAVAAVSWPEQVFRYPQPYTNIPLWHHLGYPAQRRQPEHRRNFACAGRVRRPHGHRCRPHPSGLWAFPLAAEGCPSERFCQLCGHLCPHRLPLPPSGGSKRRGHRPAPAVRAG